MCEAFLVDVSIYISGQISALDSAGIYKMNPSALLEVSLTVSINHHRATIKLNTLIVMKQRKEKNGLSLTDGL